MNLDPLTCPNKHPITKKKEGLHLFQLSQMLAGQVCDLCGRELSSSEIRWRCEQHCDYDICDTCFSQDQAALAASRPEAPSPPSGNAALLRQGSMDVVVDEDELIEEHKILEARGSIAAKSAQRWADHKSKAMDLGNVGRSAEHLDRYLGVGDILIFHDEKWGHAMLLLATPKRGVYSELHDMEPSKEVLATNVDVWEIVVLESASNFESLEIRHKLLVLHPETKQLCEVYEMEDNPDHVELVRAKTHVRWADAFLSPMTDDVFDFDLFKLSVLEVCTVPQDLQWSLSTGIRCYFKRGRLDVAALRGSEEQRRRLAEQMPRRWRAAPVCTTVPCRVWQKFLLKLAIQRSSLANRYGGVRGSPRELLSWIDDPIMAWVDDVMSLMPVKDDRCLPSELEEALVATERWKRLDLHSPPAHRDGSAGREPPRSSHWSQKSKIEDQRLPHRCMGLVNEDDVPVSLGSNFWHIYCGRKQQEWAQDVGQRMGQQMAGEGLSFEWDGTCGPHNGPQCLACRLTEDRLLV